MSDFIPILDIRADGVTSEANVKYIKYGDGGSLSDSPVVSVVEGKSIRFRVNYSNFTGVDTPSGVSRWVVYGKNNIVVQITETSTHDDEIYTSFSSPGVYRVVFISKLDTTERYISAQIVVVVEGGGGGGSFFESTAGITIWILVAIILLVVFLSFSIWLGIK